MEKRRSKFSGNNIRLQNDIAVISLYNIKNIKIAEAIVDIDDLAKVSPYNWHLHGHGYAARFTAPRLIHQLILPAPKNKWIDHINGDKLDNRKKNLRLCSPSQSGMNVPVRCNNSSGVTGVYFHKFSKKWMARITVGGKTIFLGKFKDFRKAMKVRLSAQEEYFGEFAYSKQVREND